jgi:hypothetical protein
MQWPRVFSAAESLRLFLNMTTSITASELESLRTHLGYGAVNDAYPYTADGFQALFEQVIGPNLTSGAETQTGFGIAAGSTAATPDNMTGIVTGARLVIDVGDDAEIVTVRATTPTTFSARFTKPHPINTPIAVLGGLQRLRLLLHQADQAWQAMQDQSVGSTAGLRQVDRGDVVFFEGFQVLKDRLSHYKAIVAQLSALVRVTPRESTAAHLEVY